MIFRQKQNSGAKKDALLEAHSFRTRERMPSGPYFLLLSRDGSAFWTARTKIIGRGKGLIKGASGGEGKLESLKVKLEE